MTSEGSGRADRTGTVIGMGLAAVVILAVIVGTRTLRRAIRQVKHFRKSGIFDTIRAWT